MTAAQSRLFADVVNVLIEVTGEDADWAAGITPASQLEGDLRLDSVEMLALADRLRARYGDTVDLPAHWAELDIDALIALTVNDVVAYLAQRH